MKQYVTMKKIENSVYYQYLEPADYRFLAITSLFSPWIRPNEIIDWFNDEKEPVTGNEWFRVRKEKGVIALYDASNAMRDEPDNYVDRDPTRRFQMSFKNFAEIIYQWEELRVSRPDTILVVIHEDNHVSLETDPIIIKQYQDAGYAFDYKKHQLKYKEYACYDKDFYNCIESSGVQSYHCKLVFLVLLIQKQYFPEKKTGFPWPLYKYHNAQTDDFFIGLYSYNDDETLQPAEHELATYVNAENSCQINRHNFLEFEQQWLELENNNTIFAVVYRNEQGWICCQGFNTSKEMYDFVMQTVES